MKRKKSVQRAYLLWLLGIFGLLGLHRFYLNKKRTAVVWIFTLGGFGIGTLADFILLNWLVNRYNMMQELQNLQSELISTEQWRQEMAHKLKYEEAAFNRDKEQLLRREMALLRLKLKLGREVVKGD